MRPTMPNADDHEEIAGDHVEHDHYLTDWRDRLEFHECERECDIDSVIKSGHKGCGRHIANRFELTAGLQG